MSYQYKIMFLFLLIFSCIYSLKAYIFNSMAFTGKHLIYKSKDIYKSSMKLSIRRTSQIEAYHWKKASALFMDSVPPVLDKGLSLPIGSHSKATEIK